MDSTTNHNTTNARGRNAASVSGLLMTAALIAVLSVAGRTAEAASITSVDVVVVLDESESMRNSDFNRLGHAMSQLDAALQSEGATGNRFAMVKFGAITELYNGSMSKPIFHQVQQVGGSVFGTSEQFDAALGTPRLGTQEDGFLGVYKATSLFDRDASTVGRIVILVTDEAREPVKEHGMSSKLNYAQALSALTGAGAILNVIVDNALFDGEGNKALAVDSEKTAYVHDGVGGFATELGGRAKAGDILDDYIDLAWATGGASFDLQALRATQNPYAIDALIASLIEIKIQELGLRDGPVPVPTPGSTQVLLGVGMASVIARRRVRRAA